MINLKTLIKKLIKKLRALVASEKHEAIQEYEDGYLCEVRRQLLRPGKRALKCDKCGALSKGCGRFFGEEATIKTYCCDCYIERIVAKSPPKTTNN